MTSSVHFSVKYDGPALRDHQMDVRELAPALIALSDLLENANKAVFPEAGEIRVNVTGNFKAGSFGIDFTAIQSIGEQIASLFSGQGATATANLFAILSGIGLLGSGGLIGLIKWLGKRRPSSIKMDGDKTIFTIVEHEQEDRFEVDLVAGKLYQSRIVRQSMMRVVKPLSREGVDIFASGKDGEMHNVVTKDDLPVFEFAADEDEIVSEALLENVMLQIESASFRDGNKWRFTDGASIFFAEILDQTFIDRINTGEERFGKKDVLIVNLRRRQAITDNGLRVENEIEKVLSHRAPLQTRIELDS